MKRHHPPDRTCQMCFRVTPELRIRFDNIIADHKLDKVLVWNKMVEEFLDKQSYVPVAVPAPAPVPPALVAVPARPLSLAERMESLEKAVIDIGMAVQVMKLNKKLGNK